MMEVKDLMTKDVICVDKDVDLKHVLDLMKKYEITKIPVVENKKLLGVITDNIIVYKLGSIRKRGVPAARLHASSVIDKDFETVEPDTDIKTILGKVGAPGPTILNVVENEKLLGVITKADLLPLVKSHNKVASIMQKKLSIVAPDDRVIHARRIMIDKNIARLPVVDHGKLVGMISDTEIAFALAELKKSIPLGQQRHHLDELLIEDVMKTPVTWINSDTSIVDAAKIMIENNIGALPILDNNKLAGIVTRTDLLKTVNY
jgi:CBS domain-containing protein